MTDDPGACARGIFVSDVHLDPSDPEKTERFVKFVDGLRGAGFQRAVILGDLFHYWVGPGHEALDDFRAPIESLRRLSESGVALTLVHGNRDFHLGEEMSRALGAQIWPDAGELHIAGRAIRVAHGDLLCARDTRYRAMRRVIRSRLARSAFTGLPMSIRLRVAGGMRGMSEREVAGKSARVLSLAPSAIRRLLRGPVEAAVIGHVHQARRIAVEVGGRRRLLFSLGAWDGGNESWLEVDAGGFRLHDGRGGERELEEPERI